MAVKAEVQDPNAQPGVYSGGNLNIRDNMQAAAGVLFKEGENYVDRGPSYLDKRKSSAADSMRNKPQYTRADYINKFGSQSDFAHRG